MVAALAVSTMTLTASGCAGLTGSVWRELTTEHFVLHTDMSAGSARDAITELEDLRAAVLGAAFPMSGRTPTGRIPVIVVDDRADWDDLFPRAGGMFSHTLWQPLIVMYGGNSLRRADTIKHELVHFLSRFYLPKQPRWFAEGLATFFETLEYDAKTREVSFGEPPKKELGYIGWRGLEALPKVLANDEFSYEYRKDAFYSTSWLLVHYLANTKPQAFLTYQRALQKVSEEKAWEQAFGGPQAVPTIAADLSSYLRSGRYLVLTNHFNPPVVEVVERVHTEGEARVQRALLHYMGSDSQAHEAPALGKALRDIEEALRVDPHDLLALCVRHFLLQVPVATTTAREALKRHPDDWRAWTLLWGVLRGTPSAAVAGKAALERAKALAARYPAVTLDDMGWLPD